MIKVRNGREELMDAEDKDMDEGDMREGTREAHGRCLREEERKEMRWTSDKER